MGRLALGWQSGWAVWEDFGPRRGGERGTGGCLPPAARAGPAPRGYFAREDGGMFSRKVGGGAGVRAAGPVRGSLRDVGAFVPSLIGARGAGGRMGGLALGWHSGWGRSGRMLGRVAAVGGERGAVCPPRPVPGLPPEDILAEKTGGRERWGAGPVCGLRCCRACLGGAGCRRAVPSLIGAPGVGGADRTPGLWAAAGVGGIGPGGCWAVTRRRAGNGGLSAPRGPGRACPLRISWQRRRGGAQRVGGRGRCAGCGEAGRGGGLCHDAGCGWKVVQGGRACCAPCCVLRCHGGVRGGRLSPERMRSCRVWGRFLLEWWGKTR